MEKWNYNLKVEDDCDNIKMNKIFFFLSAPLIGCNCNATDVCEYRNITIFFLNNS